MSTKTIDPQRLCDWARDLGKSHTFLDFHAHPFDVLSDDIRYTAASQLKGLFSRGLFPYRPPALETGSGDLFIPTQPASDNQRAFILSSRLTYNHTGCKVFEDQLSPVGLGGVLLLQVARTSGKAEAMLDASRSMFPQDGRFMHGCAFPVGLPAEELPNYFRSARAVYKVRAIKFHPNLAGVDPLTQTGQELVDITLRTAGELHLPIIIHGGRTPCIEPAESREYGSMPHLASVDWGISTAPVILAHAGCYGLSLEESEVALSTLKKMLEKYSNLMADVSNLEPAVLHLVLKKIASERLIFGSDALYIPIWKAWLRFLHALQMISSEPDQDLIRIACLNPLQCLALTTTSANISLPS